MVCPKSVLDVWSTECRKFAPSLRVQVLRVKEDLDLAALGRDIDLLVLNYAQLRINAEQLTGVRWLAVVLCAGFGLFAVFFVRTALRHRTRYVLGPDTLCADGPAGTLVEWSRIDRMKLSYFSTKRDRSDGWMQLTVGSAGGRTMKVDSSLDGFHDIVERAARAAEANRLELSPATRANLRAMGIVVAGQEELA